MENTYREKIYEVYKRFFGTISVEKKCKYLDQCSQGLPQQGYRSSLTVKVGKNYGISSAEVPIPKVLVIGKENPKESVVFEEPARIFGWSNPNTQYIETFKQLKAIFNFNTKERGNYSSQDDCILTCFALTNVYRCAFKRTDVQDRGIPNTPIQTRCCCEILKAEITALEPDIIILQANISPKELMADDCILVNEADCNGLYYSPQRNQYLIDVIYPATPYWHKDHPRNEKNFYKAIYFLRNNGVIPNFDTTEILASVLKSDGKD